MNKKTVYGFNTLLLVWFSLDMTGFSFRGHQLVTQAFRDDGVYFMIFAALLIFFVLKGTVGGYLLLGWLAMWFATQFASHWYFTIFGPAEDKMHYFSDTVKLIPSTHTYIPDLYHIVLHLLILVSAFSVRAYLMNNVRRPHQ